MSRLNHPSAPTPPEHTPAPPRLFGTDGIRMVVGQEWTPPFVAEVGSALATYLDGTGTVLVARDFRTSSEAMSRLLCGALMMQGIDVRDLGVMPTPCLQFNVKATGATAGATVTASHNPTEFNGIKMTGPDGLELSREAETVIERALADRKFRTGSWERIGTYRQDPDGIDRYTNSIVANTDAARIREWGPTVVLDCGNGTSLTTSPALLRSLGCRVITMNANPDGWFSGRPSEPSEENLATLRKAVVEFGADLGIAHDGDSDRAAFIDENGDFVPGEVTLAMFAKSRTSERPGATIVTSITSSSAVGEVVREMGGRLVVTRSGSLPVARGVIDKGAVFAGEENGGYYWPEHQVARDGPMSSAKMLELLARRGRPLSVLVGEVPRFYLMKTKVPLQAAGRAAEPVKARVVEQARLRLEDEAHRVETIDGVKAFFPHGWLLIRPSGTEPICRVFAESRDERQARELLGQGVALVREALSSDAPRPHER